jgi:hypothetical protein
VRRLALACAVLGCTLATGSAPLICAAAESAGDPAAFEQLLKLLSERRHGRVAFTEVQQLSILDQPLHSAGELLYDAPDRLEKRTLEPRAEDLLLENGVLTMERNHRRRSVALQDFPHAVPFIESLRATLAGDRAALERYSRCTSPGTRSLDARADARRCRTSTQRTAHPHRRRA